MLFIFSSIASKGELAIFAFSFSISASKAFSFSAFLFFCSSVNSFLTLGATLKIFCFSTSDFSSTLPISV